MEKVHFIRQLGRLNVIKSLVVSILGASIAIAIYSQEVVAMGVAVCALLCTIGLVFAYRRDMANATRHYNEMLASVQKLERDLRRDPLTGLLNRAAFKEIMQSLIDGDSAEGMIMLTFFDLNRFKEVNDTLGHEIGDMLLGEVGARAAGLLDDAIAICRLGGDEFAAIMPWDADKDAQQVGLGLVKRIAEPFKLCDRVVEVSASVGIAIGDPAIQGADELLRRADLAMYEAKTEDGIGYHVYDDMLSNRQLRANKIRTELNQNIFDDSLVMHYQPIVNARSGMIEKAETLLRANFGPLSGIAPSLMVAVAEDSGQIIKLTDWTIGQSLEASKKLGIPIAVNVSPIYFRRPDFADLLIDKILAHECTPSSLIVEVTEGVLIADVATARATIDQLRDVGVSVYLDDFGTGYSSLSYLQNFNLDGMKLDKSFLQDLSGHEKTRRIIRSLVDFSHSLDMAVVVEGVEAEWQARILRLIGCDFLQGYSLGVPMPLQDLKNILELPIPEKENELIEKLQQAG